MTTSFNESPVVFACHGEMLTGILHPADGNQKIGVLVIVGGPQYRVGSHRQFVLLARHLAKQGIPVMRFDYRGMGDSSGELHTFESVNDDIAIAIDVFMEKQPTLQKIVIWGLCDAASAALMYAWRDSRIAGLILLNPWVRTEAGEARAYLKHYYLQRIMTKAFWGKVISGKFNLFASLESLLGLANTLRKGKVTTTNAEENSVDTSMALPDRMLVGLQKFNGRILIFLSENDLTADEFRDLTKTSKGWENELKVKLVNINYIASANHTFSSEKWRGIVEEGSAEWIKGL